VGKKQVVLMSRNAPGGLLCVDVFGTGDGSYGFELYRRDTESQEGWFKIGSFSAKRFESFEDAKSAAVQEFDWFDEG
jgi:hypothetical protein